MMVVVLEDPIKQHGFVADYVCIDKAFLSSLQYFRSLAAKFTHKVHM